MKILSLENVVLQFGSRRSSTLEPKIQARAKILKKVT